MRVGEQVRFPVRMAETLDAKARSYIKTGKRALADAAWRDADFYWRLAAQRGER